jgi:hypothetical protein
MLIIMTPIIALLLLLFPYDVKSQDVFCATLTSGTCEKMPEIDKLRTGGVYCLWILCLM